MKPLTYPCLSSCSQSICHVAYHRPAAYATCIDNDNTSFLIFVLLRFLYIVWLHLLCMKMVTSSLERDIVLIEEFAGGDSPRCSYNYSIISFSAKSNSIINR